MAKKIPMRMCVGCRTMKEKRELVRIVRGENGVVSLDVTGRSNGRGAYLCADEQCLNKAFKSKAIERALEASLSPEIRDELAKEIAKRRSEGNAE